MSNLTVDERARRRLLLLDSYAVINQAVASHYVREANQLTEAEAREKLEDLQTRMQLVAVEHAVMTDMFQGTAMHDRTKEEMQERVRGVLAHLRDQEHAKPAQKRSALETLAAALKEEPDAAAV